MAEKLDHDPETEAMIIQAVEAFGKGTAKAWKVFKNVKVIKEDKG